jgi:hypothetical protein
LKSDSRRRRESENDYAIILEGLSATHQEGVAGNFIDQVRICGQSHCQVTSYIKVIDAILTLDCTKVNEKAR